MTGTCYICNSQNVNVTECKECYEKYCGNCITLCHCCNNSTCSECVLNCQGCNHNTCWKDCLVVCTDCQNQCCVCCIKVCGKVECDNVLCNLCKNNNPFCLDCFEGKTGNERADRSSEAEDESDSRPS